MKQVSGTERPNEIAAAAAEADLRRDALFENLALQSGLVRPEVMAEARKEQSLSPAALLADVLVKRNAISQTARQHLELLLDESSSPREPLAGQTVDLAGPKGAANDSSVVPSKTLSLDAQPFHAGPTPRVFAGYELLSEIARGGMGVVFKARQLKLKRNVALKMILAGEFSGEDQIRRFYTEAEAAAKLDHPNIVPVYEVGEAHGQHYYSMALIAGQSLHELVKQHGPLPPRRAAQLLKSVAQAMQYAHEKGIVHRDLKPQNILLEADDHPKVTDFGLAKNVNNLSDLTLLGQVIGTPSYMPPEQATGKGANVGPLADVYALGATLYFLLAGHAPFQGSTPAETIRQVLETEPIPLRRQNREIPRDLETICLKCLRKTPADRYESAGAVALDLRRWLANEPIVARPVGHLERAWLWCRRRPALAAFPAACALIIAAAAVVARSHLHTVRAAGLVDALVTSDTQDVERLISQMQPYRRWATPLLRQKLDEARDDSKQKFHASLSLAGEDPRQADYLLDRLADATPDESLLIGRVLLPDQSDVVDRLWQTMENPRKRKDRLRIASVLALWSPRDARWPPWSGELASLLVTMPLSEAQPWIDNLRPAGQLLAPDLERIYREPTAAGSAQRRVAVTALATMSDDPRQLIELALLAESAQELQPLLAALRTHGAYAVDGLRKVLLEPVAVEVYSKPRDALWEPHVARDQTWRRQAIAAVCLLNLDADEGIWSLLLHSSNPTLRSNIILLLHQLGTPYGLLAARLRIETDEDVQRSLILSLGAYDRQEISAEDLEQIERELLLLCQTSPHAGVHSAADWTLRRWNRPEALPAVAQSEATSTPAGTANWFLNSRGTMLVRVPGPVTFTMFEPTNQTVPTKVVLDYPFAVAAHEVTIHEFREFDPTWAYDVTYAPKPDCPMHRALSWQLAAAYCNWLSSQEGLPREQWAYEGDGASGLTLSPDFVRRQGYRLPTEAEWEYACKAGTTTIFSCGETVESLDAYAWYKDNASAKCWPVGSKMPNDLGLFDMHGNVMEWCHKQVADANGKVAVVFGKTPNTCVLRGGSSYLAPMGVRSDYRWVLAPPQEFHNSLGFRLAKSLPKP